MGETAGGRASATELARAHGGDAHRLAMVAGADHAAASRAAVHALVIAAVKGGVDAERPAILALARSWALSSPGAARAATVGTGTCAVAAAFWDLPEPMRSALWCEEALGLHGGRLDQVVPGGRAAAAVARGRIRRSVCRRQREAARGACAPVAEVLGRVLAGSLPASRAAQVDSHVESCERCAGLLGDVRSPIAAVERGLPGVPDLVVPAQKAWRKHVGASRHPLADQARRVTAATPRRQRSLAAALAVITAGMFAGATSQLATATERPPAVVAAPVLAPARPAPTPPRVVRPPQAVLAPLADDAVLAPLVTPDLAQVTPATLPEPPPTLLPAASGAVAVAEAQPAVAESRTYDLRVPLLTPLPLTVEVGPCTTISWAPFASPSRATGRRAGPQRSGSVPSQERTPR